MAAGPELNRLDGGRRAADSWIMRVAIAQVNPIVGDLRGNRGLVEEAAGLLGPVALVPREVADDAVSRGDDPRHADLVGAVGQVLGLGAHALALRGSGHLPHDAARGEDLDEDGCAGVGERSAEAGVGVVPQVLWPEGQEITMAHYLTAKKGDGPQMLVYSGKVAGCYDTPPAGGCRTNVVLTINEVDACDAKGMHQTIFYGSHAQQLKAYCQMFGITATV